MDTRKGSLEQRSRFEEEGVDDRGESVSRITKREGWPVYGGGQRIRVYGKHVRCVFPELQKGTGSQA